MEQSSEYLLSYLSINDRLVEGEVTREDAMDELKVLNEAYPGLECRRESLLFIVGYTKGYDAGEAWSPSRDC